MSTRTVTLEGWFCIAKEYPDLKRAVLDDDLFKFSIRSIDVGKLRVTPLERIAGSFWNPTYVTGIVDVTGSLIPFFIHRQKVEKLQNLINAARDESEIIL